MKKINLALVVLVISKISFGQTNPKIQTLSPMTKLDIGLQGIGLTYEPRFSNNVTTDLSFGFGGGYDISEVQMAYELIRPALYFSVTPKYFYNIKTRINKGKSVQNNSGNYIGVRIKYNTPLYKKSDVIRNSILTNIHWGLQRPMGDNWLFSSHFGVGYATDIDYNYGTIYPSLDFKFSYVFPRQRK